MEISCPLCVTPGAKCVEIAKLLMICECDECGAGFTLHLSEQSIVRSERLAQSRLAAALPKPA